MSQICLLENEIMGLHKLLAATCGCDQGSMVLATHTIGMISEVASMIVFAPTMPKTVKEICLPTEEIEKLSRVCRRVLYWKDPDNFIPYLKNDTYGGDWQTMLADIRRA